jgi:hypothetical protein
MQKFSFEWYSIVCHVHDKQSKTMQKTKFCIQIFLGHSGQAFYLTYYFFKTTYTQFFYNCVYVLLLLLRPSSAAPCPSVSSLCILGEHLISKLLELREMIERRRVYLATPPLTTQHNLSRRSLAKWANLCSRPLTRSSEHSSPSQASQAVECRP